MQRDGSLIKRIGPAAARRLAAMALAALAAMAVALWFAGGDPGPWLEWRLGTRLWRLALVVCCGAGVYFATLWLVGFRLEDFRRRAAE